MNRINLDQVSKVSTPEMAYTLGLIWADGHLNRCRGVMYLVLITQATADMPDIQRTLDKIGTWKYNAKKVASGEMPSTIANICNRPVAEYLESKGYTNKSTGSADAILATIPDHLKHYWFRGLFDGDGNIFFKKGRLPTQGIDKQVSIASDYDQDWSYMENLATQLNIDYVINRTINRDESRTGRRNRSSTFMMRRRRDIACFMEYIYRGREQDKIGLKRKWRIWSSLRKLKVNSSNRYLGVYHDKNRWVATIPPKDYGLKKSLYLGRHLSEQEAYKVQQDMINSLGLKKMRERHIGERHRRIA